MIQQETHRRILLNILNDIYRNDVNAPLLGFKGGTYLYFFHELPRFSTDLDFNLLAKAGDFQAEFHHRNPPTAKYFSFL